MSTVEDLSLELEAETGADSIPTIAKHYRIWNYDRDTYSDVLECVFPDCGWRCRDPERMWRHVHASRKHGHSFGARSPEALAADREFYA